MPYRRRSYKGRGDKLLAFRTGSIAVGGGKAFTPKTKTYTAKVTAAFQTTGDPGCCMVSFSPQEYSIPLAQHQIYGLAYNGSAFRHPTGHRLARSNVYSTAKVLACSYRIMVTLQGVSDPTNGFIVAHKFTHDATIAQETPIASGATLEFFQEMRMTKSWTYKRFSGVQSGGSIFPTDGYIHIKVPSVPKLSYGMNHQAIGAEDNDPFKRPIIDTTTTTITSAERPLYLVVVVFAVDGQTLAAGEIHLEVDWVGKVKLYKQQEFDQTIVDPGSDADD